MTSSNAAGPACRRVLQATAAALAALVLAACGGGGGGGSNGGSGGGSGGGTVAACEANLPVMQATASNQMQVVVDGGPCASFPLSSGAAATVQQVGFYNAAYTTVTVCVPGTSTCQSIDHVLVDTGSSGLRIMASVLNANLLSTSSGLPPVTVGGAPLIECTQFASGYSWGSVRAADVKIANESTVSLAPSGISVQVIGDSESIAIPNGCTSSYGTPPPAPTDTVTTFGANGVLGVGLYVEDCGANCGSAATNLLSVYFPCPGGVCGSAVGIDKQQVSNPVSYFGTDNQGVILTMGFPTFNNSAAAAAPTVLGTLTFGLNTVPPGGPPAVAGANYLTYPGVNTTGTQNVYLADQFNGFVACVASVTPQPAGTLTLTTTSLPPPTVVQVAPTNAVNTYSYTSLIDSGSNAVFLPINSGPGTGTALTLPTDTNDWYTPSAPVAIGATLQNFAASNTCTAPPPVTNQVFYTLQNADTLFANTANNALYGLGGPNALPGQPNLAGIDFGLPFFYGKSIAVAVESVPNTTTANGFGPNNVAVPQGGTTSYPGPFWSFLFPSGG